MKSKNSPGVYIPPPLIYASMFGLGWILQSTYPLKIQAVMSPVFHNAGWAFILLTTALLLPSLWKFWKTENTLITVKPAKSLQTTGVYAFTRNPMYLGLLLLYIGISCFTGNCWALIFLPILFLIVQNYIIDREERYLDKAFGDEYKMYKRSTRRWI